MALYLDSPQNAIVLSVDEKPSIQPLERKTGYVETDSSKIVRGYKSAYKRHGTLNLCAALQVGADRVHTAITERKRREEFLRFMATEHPLVFLTFAFLLRGAVRGGEMFGLGPSGGMYQARVGIASFYFGLFASRPWTAVSTRPRAISGFDAKWACIYEPRTLWRA